MENWVPVARWESLYEVSDLGRIRSIPKVVIRADGQRYPVSGRVLKATRSGRRGYRCSMLCDNGRSEWVLVHRVVLESFRGPCPIGKQTRHKDGNPGNNALSNLCYGTAKKNAEDRDRHGRTYRGPSHWKAALNEEKVRKIKRMLRRKKYTKAAIARRFHVGPFAIYAIATGRTWKYVD